MWARCSATGLTTEAQVQKQAVASVTLGGVRVDDTTIHCHNTAHGSPTAPARLRLAPAAELP